MTRKKRQYTKRKLTASEIGYKHGFRSGLEDKISKQIAEAGIEVQYETEKILYLVPSKNRKYTPDFKIPKKDGSFFYIETKGRFELSDRQKHEYIREQHPGIDLRFIFSNANNKLYKGSKSTYADWCDKHKFVWANKTIPQEWLCE